MSFILDALRKSETERQQDTGPGIAASRYGAAAKKPNRWIPILAIFLAANAILLFSLLWRDQDTPEIEPAANTAEIPAIPVNPPPMPRAARPGPEVRPLASEAAAATQKATPTAASSAEPANQSKLAEPATDSTDRGKLQDGEITQTLQELLVAGELELPPLRIDIHVYSDDPPNRFVFINMTKYREGDRLSEGPLLKEVDPTGVLLSHEGKTFRLDRE